MTYEWLRKSSCDWIKLRACVMINADAFEKKHFFKMNELDQLLNESILLLIPGSSSVAFEKLSICEK